MPSRRILLALVLVTLFGALTVFRAEATLPPTIDLDTTPAGLTVYGDDADVVPRKSDESGFSVATGDINGDGTDDLVIGAYLADPAGGSEAGETYVIYGGAGLPTVIDLNITSADLTVYGDDANDQAGKSVAAGDINGDGVDDLIIGANGADPGGRSNAGETYVIYGGPSLPAIIDLNATSADLTVYGDAAENNSGFSLAAGDINGDTTDDLIIGVSKTDLAVGIDAGETHVIYGGPSLPAIIDLNSTSADLTVRGDDAGDLSGFSVAAGDINGDNTDDLIIGAWQADPAGGTEAGETYVIFGGPSLPAIIDLDQCPGDPAHCADLTVYGDDASDGSGRNVATGDIDGDTTHDLIIGAIQADPPGGSLAGETYVIYGGPGLPATIDLNATSADLTVYGDDAGDVTGFSAAAGNIDADEDPPTDDLIIGAHKADGSGNGTSCGTGEVGDRCEAGETYVIYGDALPNTPGGTNVCVSLNGGLGEVDGIEVCFSDVTASGITTVDVSTPCPPGTAPDTGFIIWGLGGQSSCYDINTTASFTGLVQICITYDDTGLTSGRESILTLKRTNSVPPGPQWTELADITLDEANNVICGDSETLSFFTIQLIPSVGGIAELPDVASAPLDAEGSSGLGAGVVAGIAAAVTAGALALAGAALYARRRFTRG